MHAIRVIPGLRSKFDQLPSRVKRVGILVMKERRTARSYCLQMERVLLLVLLASLAVTPTFSQSIPERTVTTREQVWLAYMGQARIAGKFGAWLDIQHRQTGDFVDRPWQFIFRPAATYFVRDNLRLNAGYAFVNHFPAEGYETSQPEHRLWQQLWAYQTLPHVRMFQWLRFEQRFLRKIQNDQLTDGYYRANRLRYNISVMIPFKGKEVLPGMPFFTFSNELFLNFGKNVVYNTFDQNRMFAGLGYQLTAHMNVQAVYMNIYQQLPTGHHYAMSHAIRVSIFQNLDFR
jgi:hypothetical protein